MFASAGPKTTLPDQLKNFTIIQNATINATTELFLDTLGGIWGSSTDANQHLLLTGNKKTATPTPLSYLPPIQTLKSSDSFALMLAKNGEVWGLGSNEFGELGLGHNQAQMKPIKILGLDNIEQIEVGPNWAFCLDNKGSVYVVGNNIGQLGLGNKQPVFVPVKISFLPPITQIVAGKGSTFFLDKEGKVWVCGGPCDYLGLGEINQQPVLPTMIPNLPKIKKITHGFQTTFLEDEYGNVWGFGLNDRYQLGVAHSKLVKSPVKIPNLKNCKQIEPLEEGATLFIDGEKNLLAAGTCGYKSLVGMENQELIEPMQLPYLHDIDAIHYKKNRLVFHSAKEGEVWLTGFNFKNALNQNIFNLAPQLLFKNIKSLLLTDSALFVIDDSLGCVTRTDVRSTLQTAGICMLQAQISLLNAANIHLETLFDMAVSNHDENKQAYKLLLNVLFTCDHVTRLNYLLRLNKTGLKADTEIYSQLLLSPVVSVPVPLGRRFNQLSNNFHTDIERAYMKLFDYFFEQAQTSEIDSMELSQRKEDFDLLQHLIITGQICSHSQFKEHIEKTKSQFTWHSLEFFGGYTVPYPAYSKRYQALRVALLNVLAKDDSLYEHLKDCMRFVHDVLEGVALHANKDNAERKSPACP